MEFEVSAKKAAAK
jgi:hypothetical protein